MALRTASRPHRKETSAQGSGRRTTPHLQRVPSRHRTLAPCTTSSHLYVPSCTHLIIASIPTRIPTRNCTTRSWTAPRTTSLGPPPMSVTSTPRDTSSGGLCITLQSPTSTRSCTPATTLSTRPPSRIASNATSTALSSLSRRTVQRATARGQTAGPQRPGSDHRGELHPVQRPHQPDADLVVHGKIGQRAHQPDVDRDKDCDKDGESVIPAHEYFLAIVSPVFEEQLHSENEENGESDFEEACEKIKIRSDSSYKDVVVSFKYIYEKRTVNLAFNDSLDLLKPTERFQIESMSVDIEELIVELNVNDKKQTVGEIFTKRRVGKERSNFRKKNSFRYVDEATVEFSDTGNRTLMFQLTDLENERDNVTDLQIEQEIPIGVCQDSRTDRYKVSNGSNRDHRSYVEFSRPLVNFSPSVIDDITCD